MTMFWSFLYDDICDLYFYTRCIWDNIIFNMKPLTNLTQHMKYSRNTTWKLIGVQYSYSYLYLIYRRVLDSLGRWASPSKIQGA